MRTRIVWSDKERQQIALNHIRLFGNECKIRGIDIGKAQAVLPPERRRSGPFQEARDPTIWALIRQFRDDPPAPEVSSVEVFVPKPPSINEVLKSVPTADLIVEIERRKHIEYEFLLGRIHQLEVRISQFQHPAPSPLVDPFEIKAEPPPKPPQERLVLIGCLNSQWQELKIRYRLANVDLLFVDKDKSPNVHAIPTSANLIIMNAKFTNHSWINLVKDFAACKDIPVKTVHGGFSAFQTAIEDFFGEKARKQG